MKLLCITDPKTHPPFDTTVELYNKLAGDKRIDLFHTSPIACMAGGEISFSPVPEPLAFEQFLALTDDKEKKPWSFFDAVYVRADKPFPPGFYDTLSRFEGETRFINSPRGCEIVSRRSFLARFSEHMPVDLFTRDAEEIRRFIEEHREVVVKREISYGGKGVYRTSLQDEGVEVDNVVEGKTSYSTLNEAVSALLALDNEPLQLVRYLKNGSYGDKRVLVVGSEIFGAFLRRSSSGHWVHNITSGGSFELAEVTDKEREIIHATLPHYHEEGVYTLGYDFLMDDDGSWTLSEINAGNIGGYGRLEQLTGEAVYSRLINWIIEGRR